MKTIRELLERHGFTFSKAMGQNFIVNPGICPRMAQEGGAAPGTGVIEIGAGIGVLTAELAKRAQRVVCVELDSRLLPILDETLAPFDNVKIVNQDILKTDLQQLIREELGGMEVVVCANLPYYITSPVIMYLLESRLPIRSVTVMVQKEAAKRITAQPGTRDIGAISLAIRYYAEPKFLFNVSRGSFLPAPDVDSAVIRLEVLESPPVSPKDEALFFKVIRGGFSQRRKTLANSLSSYLGLDKSVLPQLLSCCGLSPSARPEELTLDDFCRLSNVLAERS